MESICRFRVHHLLFRVCLLLLTSFCYIFVVLFLLLLCVLAYYVCVHARAVPKPSERSYLLRVFFCFALLIARERRVSLCVLSSSEKLMLLLACGGTSAL